MSVDPAVPALAGLGITAFACFTWGTLYHFARRGDAPPGAWAISLLSLALVAQFIWRVGRQGAPALWWLGLCLIGGSIAMWLWTIRHTRRTPPTLAFSDDEPGMLFVGGPYRWVRHPFYSAYLMFWVGTAAGSRGLAGWAFAGVISAAYWLAARREEAKFARSPLADRYEAYRRHTGMFLPWPVGAR